MFVLKWLKVQYSKENTSCSKIRVASKFYGFALKIGPSTNICLSKKESFTWAQTFSLRKINTTAIAITIITIIIVILIMLISYFKNDHLPNFFKLYEIIFFLRVCFIALWKIIFTCIFSWGCCEVGWGKYSFHAKVIQRDSEQMYTYWVGRSSEEIYIYMRESPLSCLDWTVGFKWRI